MVEDLDTIIGSESVCGYEGCESMPVAMVKSVTEIEGRTEDIDDGYASVGVYYCDKHLENLKSQGKSMIGVDSDV
jgi:hypothetical protein